MKSIQEYSSEFQSIMDSYGVTGTHVDILVSVLSYALYTSELNRLSYTNETSMAHAVNLNSKITLAMNRMYSVFRGTNTKATIEVEADSSINWSKNDVLFESSDFNIYVDPESNGLALNPADTGTVSVIISNNQYTETFTTDDIENVYFVELNSTNLSDDVYIRYNGEEFSKTRSFLEHIEEGKFFDLTIPDYSSRIYRSGGFVEDNVNSSPDLQAIVYEYFDDDTIDLGSISINSVKILSTSIIKAVSRETESSIEYNYNSYIRANSIFRSNSDILDKFNAVFTSVLDSSFVFDDNAVQKIADASGITDTYRYENKIYYNESDGIYYQLQSDLTTLTALGSYTVSDNIQVYYIPETLGLDILNADDLSTFQSDLAYYIKGDINTPVEARLVPLTMDVTLYSESGTVSIDVSNIDVALSTYEYDLGLELPYRRIISALSKITNVDYVDVTFYDQDGGVVNVATSPTFYLNKDEYIVFNKTVNISTS